jgi:hypothetical protein
VDNEIDFFGLAAILLLDIIYYIIKLVNWCKYGNSNIDKVNPEEHNPEEEEERGKVSVELVGEFSPPKKQNKYDDSSDDLNLQNSRGELKESVKRANQRRRR